MDGVRKVSKKLVCGALGALMVLLAGCQSVGGLDANKKKANTVPAFPGKQRHRRSY